MAAGSGRFLVAELVNESCAKTAVAAVVDGARTVTLWRGSEPDAELRERGLAAFRRLPGYVEQQRDFERATGTKKPWDRYGGPDAAKDGEGVALRVYEANRARYLFLAASAGEGCGDFEGTFWAAFKVQSELLLVSDAKDPGFEAFGFKPELAADFDGDGVPELVAKETVATLASGALRLIYDTHAPVFDCGC
jgi:hypothetical protein